VAFAYLPEATEFRGWYPPEVERAARDHLGGLCRDLAVPLVDAREWMPDGSMVDGFHLSRSGAAAFTRRLVPAVAAALPGLGGRP
jgi:lysophospholipase L1-like esterase